MAKIKKRLTPELLYTNSIDMHTLWDIRHNGHYVNPRNLSWWVRLWNAIRVRCERKVQRLVIKGDIANLSRNERKAMLNKFELICKQENYTYVNSAYLEMTKPSVQKDEVVTEADSRIVMPPSTVEKEAYSEEKDTADVVSPVSHLPSNNATVFQANDRIKRRENQPRPGTIIEAENEAKFEETVSALKAEGMISIDKDTVATIQQDNLDTTKF